MLNQIVDALHKRSDLVGWTVREVQSREAQVYAVPQGIESSAQSGWRKVSDRCDARYFHSVMVLPQWEVGMLPSFLVRILIRRSTRLPWWQVWFQILSMAYPGLLNFQRCLFVIIRLQKNSMEAMLDVMERIQTAASNQGEVRLTAAECFGEAQYTHLINSRGIDVKQESTSVEVEFVLHGRRGEAESETFNSIIRRRVADLDLETAIQDRVQYTLNSLVAKAPSSWQGPVVLRGDALTIFLAGDNLNGSVIQTLASADAKFAQISPWEVGKSVFRDEVKGDPLTVWANRLLPFGVASDRFDAEGLPASRVELIQENVLSTFAASQRYAEYLKIPSTGAFGNIEMPPGMTPDADLLAEPHIEIVQFSWFNPDTVTGDFATEIRFGYLVENGLRQPFKGGQIGGKLYGCAGGCPLEQGDWIFW